MVRYIPLTRRARDNFRKLGGRFYITGDMIQILFGDVLLKCITINEEMTERIYDVVITALVFIERMTPKQREKAKHYK